MSSTNQLQVFVKAPSPGQVKRRLQPEISRNDAVNLYKAMAEDLVARFRNVLFFDMKIIFWPPDSRDDIEGWLGTEYEYEPQDGSNLGERMLHGFEYAFAHGYQKATIIGTDIPTLTVESLREAFVRLESCDVVLGPSHDGGYYLIGLKELHPKLFEGMDWGSERVREQTLHAAEELRLSVHQLEMRRDIDTYADALQFWLSLRQSEQHPVNTRMPRLYNALKKLFQN